MKQKRVCKQHPNAHCWIPVERQFSLFKLLLSPQLFGCRHLTHSASVQHNRSKDLWCFLLHLCFSALIPPSDQHLSVDRLFVFLRKKTQLKPATSLNNCLIHGPARKEISKTSAEIQPLFTILTYDLIFGFVWSVFSWRFLEMTTKAEQKGLQKEISQFKTNCKTFLKILPNYSFSKMFMNFETSWWAAVPRGRCLNPWAEKKNSVL